MRLSVCIWVLVFSIAIATSFSAAKGSSNTLQNSMQSLVNSQNLTSNFASAEVDGDLSEWANEELRCSNLLSFSSRGTNTSILLKIASNESHYFGYLEIEDDPLFSAFPFRTNETKIGDVLIFEFHDMVRTREHDGFACGLFHENYTENILELWNESAFSDFAPFPATKLAIADLDFPYDYPNEDQFEFKSLNTSTEWLNISYVHDDGHYVIWFAKSNNEFNTSDLLGFPTIEIEFSRQAFYTNGTNNPFNNTISANAGGRNLIQEVEVHNTTGESLNSLNWPSIEPVLNNTRFSKFYGMPVTHPVSMGFRNDEDTLYVALEVDFPYVNETMQVFGETIVPMFLRIYLEVDESVPGELQSRRQLMTTIFNDNVTSLFTGIQLIDANLSQYPNNYDKGSWTVLPVGFEEEYPFAFTHSVFDETSADKYFIEFSTDLSALNIEEYGNGTHGVEISVFGNFWLIYFNQKDWGYLANRVEEERNAHRYYNHLWEIPGELSVGSEYINNNPSFSEQFFYVTTGLYPIRNLNVTLDESQGFTIVETQILDDQPFVAELTYEVVGGKEETRLEFLPLPEREGYYRVEIPDLRVGDKVFYQISVRDRFNTTTTTQLLNFEFGSRSSSSQISAPGLLFIVANILLLTIRRRISFTICKRGEHDKGDHT